MEYRHLPFGQYFMHMYVCLQFSTNKLVPFQDDFNKYLQEKYDAVKWF